MTVKPYQVVERLAFLQLDFHENILVVEFHLAAAGGNELFPVEFAKGVGDVDENLREFQAALAANPQDIQILGVGADGHIGFNEPGDRLYCSAHMETLDESTIDANARFFASRDEVPRRAVTMGVGDIMNAKSLLLIISGSNKEQAAKLLLMSDEVTPRCPVTLMKLHRDSTVIISRELAEKLNYAG